MGAHLLQALGYATMLLLPLYLDHLGASRAQVGQIMATSAVGGLALRPLAGWALDTWGRRPTLMVGTVVLVCAMGMVGLVDRIGWLIYVQRLLLGVGVGTLFTGYFTFAADIIPPSRRTEGIALFGISGLLPLAFNAFVSDLGVAPAQLRVFFPVVGCVIALSLVALWVLKEPPSQRHASEPVTLGEAGRALLKRPLWPVWWSTAVFSGLVAVFMAFATVAAEARGVDRPAALWLTYAAGAVGVRLFGARLPDWVGTRNMVAPALGLYTGAMLLAASAQSAEAFLVAGLLAGLGHGYCFPVLTSQVVDRAPARVRGSALATFTALWDITALTMTPLLGRVADLFDDRTMFALGALFAVVGLAIWVNAEHRLGAQPERADNHAK